MSINTVATAFEAGMVNGSFIGFARSESIRRGIVTQSELRATIYDAPNSPKDMAKMKIVEMMSEPRIKGNFIL